MKAVLYGMTFAALAVSASSHAQISVSIGIAPPALPIYAQPPIPGDGYIWTPGYWSWDGADNDYYWVPGTWVSAPFVGALWTPGYWGWGDGSYAWHRGYWGSHIGYYGGINYGFGYGGVGYQGGYWNNGAFSYNRSVNNVGSGRIAHLYSARIDSTPGNRVSYNGGRGGVRLQPSRAEQSIANMPHNGPTAPQAQHELASHGNSVQRASVNHGMPKVAATPEPGAFNAPNVSGARQAQVQRFNRPQGVTPQHMQAQQHTREPQRMQAPQHMQAPQRMQAPQQPQASFNRQPAAQQAAPQQHAAPASHGAERPAGPHQDGHR
ncbi:MAG: hypothetical protein P4L91_20390 [Burkholderiaceae bacterium]|nr:hypothetical protein [Burkholderiaceae bacterium]